MYEPQQLLTEAETAHHIGMSRAWLRLARMRMSGPVYIKLGRSVRYRLQDLDAYLETHKVKPSARYASV